MATAAPAPSAPAIPKAASPRFERIGLLPFVAVLYAYCAGGPFGFEAMVSTSGPGLSLIYLLVLPLLFSVPMALATSEMASAMPVEGGFYRWTRAACGDFWGFQCGWWNWTGTFLMCGAYGVMLADYVARLAPAVTGWRHWLLAVGFIAVVAWMNVRGIRVVGNTTLILLVLLMLPVLWFTVAGLARLQGNPFLPVTPPGKPWQEVFGVGLALALWIYSGYEQLSTVIEEVEEPQHNFPRGLALVVPLAALSFILPLAAGLGALGNWQEWDTGYLVTAARQVGGSGMEWAMFAAAAISAFILLESTLLSSTRLPFTMSEDEYFSPALAKLHPRFHTPARAIVLSAAFCAALAVFRLTQLIAVYVWMRAASSTLTLIALWRLRRAAPDLPRRFLVPGGTLGLVFTVTVPIALFVWALVFSDPEAKRWGPVGLALGSVAYWFCRSATSRAEAPHV